MRASNLFFQTIKETPKEAKIASYQLLLKGGFIYQTASGSFSFLPLGYRVFHKIKEIIQEELKNAGCQEILMPVVQPARLWKETGRYSSAGSELLKAKGREEEFVLGMTHEEIVTDIVRNLVHSYEDLPFILNQIQTKFRDEPRPRGGLLRLKEFVMQDAYSFDRDEKGLDENYQKIVKAYKKIFERLELAAKKVEAFSGIMGGSTSEEFMVLSDVGEDEVAFCSKCNYQANKECIRKDKCPKCNSKLELKKAIELGHTFKLGTKYSLDMKAYFTDKDGRKKPILMGCYGMGLDRILATIVETHHDKDGIVWPKSVTPFDIYLVDLSTDSKGKKIAEDLYQKLEKANVDVLYDDRDKPPGYKFTDADLVGCPLRLIISSRTLVKSCIEVKERDKKETKLVKLNQVEKLWQSG